MVGKQSDTVEKFAYELRGAIINAQDKETECKFGTFIGVVRGIGTAGFCHVDEGTEL